MPPDRLIPVWFAGLFGVALTIGCGAARKSRAGHMGNFQGDFENIHPFSWLKDAGFQALEVFCAMLVMSFFKELLI
ncbi:hypothetical protein [Thalassospira sp. MCCC 1A01428]|uniref:hypothetical protein n=1 Tax=Thalassospira sp. MCCC 1A01428 TaxID=1470575 RepID=UPI00111BD2BE|nr:hypothetical protein [Thalassospira sp. MCCC 1A01428]